MNIKDEFITPQEMAQLANVSKHTAYLWLRKGFIKYYAVGGNKRIKREDFEEWNEARKRYRNIED